jgi:hypothetical protein
VIKMPVTVFNNLDAFAKYRFWAQKLLAHEDKQVTCNGSGRTVNALL